MSEKNDRSTPNGRSQRTHTAGAFDIRTLIAALLGLYGLILVVVGIVNSSDADLEKSSGTNINLWTGISLLVAAAAFQAWAMWRPVIVPPDPESTTDDDRPAAHH